jgi:hypothetical protein
MKKLKIAMLAMVLAIGCQYNSLEPEFDCSTSDLTFTATITNTDCGLSTGKIEIIASGGEQPYFYSLNEELSQDSPVFEGLPAGEYSIKVSDSFDCSSESMALVSNKNGLSVSATSINSDCLTANGMIVIIASSGVEPYQYQLGSESPQSTASFVVGPGIHDITITDAIGCSFVMSKQVNSNVSFASDVQPIIANSCSVFGCHDGSNSSLPNFNNISQLEANASMVKSRTQSGNMPRGSSLTQNQIDLIACWVDDGAKND